MFAPCRSSLGLSLQLQEHQEDCIVSYRTLRVCPSLKLAPLIANALLITMLKHSAPRKLAPALNNV